jgi:transposase
LSPRLINLINRRYDAPKESPFMSRRRHQRRYQTPQSAPHHLLWRLSTRKEDTLRFLPDVPFTNYQAERGMMKLKQKISGGFRSQEGAEGFAVIRTLISTAKKQGCNVIHALTHKP